MKQKLTKLSPEQEALIPVVRDEWIEFALGQTGPIDNPREHINWAYSLAGLKPPRLLIEVESPMAAQLVQNILRWMSHGAVDNAVNVAVSGAVDGAVDGAVNNAVGNAVRVAVNIAVNVAVSGAVDGAVDGAVNNAVGNAVSGAVGVAVDNAVNVAVSSAVDGAVEGAVGNAVRGAVDGAIHGAVDNAVNSAVNSAVKTRLTVAVAVRVAVDVAVRVAVNIAVSGAVSSAVDGAVDGAVRGAVRDAIHGAVNSAVNGAVKKWQYDYFSWIGACWSGWTAYFDFFHRIGIELPEIYARWRSLMRSGLWNCLFYENCAIVCRRPSKVHKDDQGRLHSITGPAIEWADGFRLYFVNGVSMHNGINHPLDVCFCTEIERPETITPQRILDERNVEVRKALIQIMGVGKFLEQTKAELLDEDTDASDMPRRLFRFEAGDGQRWCVVEVECPSKRAKHYIWVPPNTERCSQGVAWTFGFDAPELYRPAVEA